MLQFTCVYMQKCRVIIALTLRCQINEDHIYIKLPVYRTKIRKNQGEKRQMMMCQQLYITLNHTVISGLCTGNVMEVLT